jgi:hypothetical protein
MPSCKGFLSFSFNIPRRFEAFHKLLIAEGLEVSLKTIVVDLMEDPILVYAPMCL